MSKQGRKFINACMILVVGIILLIVGFEYLLPINETLGIWIIFFGILCLILTIVPFVIPEEKK